MPEFYMIYVQKYFPDFLGGVRENAPTPFLPYLLRLYALCHTQGRSQKFVLGGIKVFGGG